MKVYLQITYSPQAFLELFSGSWDLSQRLGLRGQDLINASSAVNVTFSYWQSIEMKAPSGKSAPCWSNDKKYGRFRQTI